jgi:hypothetical protein
MGDNIFGSDIPGDGSGSCSGCCSGVGSGSGCCSGVGVGSGCCSDCSSGCCSEYSGVGDGSGCCSDIPCVGPGASTILDLLSKILIMFKMYKILTYFFVKYF